MFRAITVVLMLGLLASSITSALAASSIDPRDPTSTSTRISESTVTSISRTDTVLSHSFEPEPGRDISDVYPRIDDVPWDPEYVFPPDDRWQVSPAVSYVAFIFAEFLSFGVGLPCTATFIGPRVLVTAAHCIFDPELGGWPDEIRVIPGADGPSTPYGVHLVSTAHIPNGRAANPTNLNVVDDYGVITLPNSDIGDATGWRSLGLLTDESLAANNLNAITYGYPRDKPDTTQWAAQVPALDDFNAEIFTSQLDQYQGQSGSSIFRESDQAIFGIVSIQVPINGSYVNLSRRINQDVIDFVSEACTEASCTFSYFIEDLPQPPPPPPQPPHGSPDSNFLRTWERTDKPVKEGIISRTWMWGDGPNTSMVVEQYAEAPGGFRTVQYYDKSRMEDNSWRSNTPPPLGCHQRVACRRTDDWQDANRRQSI